MNKSTQLILDNIDHGFYNSWSKWLNMILLAAYEDDEDEFNDDNEDVSPTASSDEGTLRQQSLAVHFCHILI